MRLPLVIVDLKYDLERLADPMRFGLVKIQIALVTSRAREEPFMEG